MGVLRAFFPHVVSREQQGWLGDPFAPGYPFRLLVVRTSPYERGLTFLLSKPEGSRLSSGGFNELRPDFPFPLFLTSYEVLDCMISIIAYGRLLFWPVSEFNCRVELGAWSMLAAFLPSTGRAWSASQRVGAIRASRRERHHKHDYRSQVQTPHSFCHDLDVFLRLSVPSAWNWESGGND
ncbi:predicted protein [Histoplasma capsulatum G186AR]|uniref:Uncharacterized protein n=1 Tax=Ajellomyces capsulatus (strain G186AR / H82 / ATCC MYA-2454 / RMSCC 2432) TaxID=447093 RepID=C0NW25_AJECG|nr:uncharacterized protein HCBG_07355 [Histoplasma capsulatum G186AR]EEH04130.1 predicted protein [Histoplasma capsulatum G186AR]